MPIIGGCTGLHFLGTDPVAGTDCVQTITIGATPTSGTFKLAFEGFISPAITWSETTSNLLANVEAALNGVAEVQTITFAGTIVSGTFRLSYKNQPTANITWSSTNNTLRDNVDTALEALEIVPASEVVTAVGTMTNGVGTLTVTFATAGPQPLIEVYENNVSGATITVSRTTTGRTVPSIGADGIAAADSNLSGGVGDFLITFDGARTAKKPQSLITVASNDLVGTGATLATTISTPGVSASFRDAGLDALLIGNDAVYINAGTVLGSPNWATF